MGYHILALFFRKSKKSANTVAFFRDDPYKQMREQRPAKTAMNRLAAHEERKQDLEGDRYHVELNLRFL